MKKYWLLFILFALFACQNKQEPKNILDRTTYKNIMRDLILAQKTKEVIRTQDTTFPDPIALVYKTYGIDSIKLKKSTDYYAKNPKFFEEIYTEILKELQHKKDSLSKIIDSLHNPVKIRRKRIPKNNTDSILINKKFKLPKKFRKP